VELTDPEVVFVENPSKPSSEKKSKGRKSTQKNTFIPFSLLARPTTGTLISRQKVMKIVQYHTYPLRRMVVIFSLKMMKIICIGMR
jgi:hypothetical protein